MKYLKHSLRQEWFFYQLWLLFVILNLWCYCHGRRDVNVLVDGISDDQYKYLLEGWASSCKGSSWPWVGLLDIFGSPLIRTGTDLSEQNDRPTRSGITINRKRSVHVSYCFRRQAEKRQNKAPLSGLWNFTRLKGAQDLVHLYTVPPSHYYVTLCWSFFGQKPALPFSIRQWINLKEATERQPGPCQSHWPRYSDFGSKSTFEQQHYNSLRVCLPSSEMNVVPKL